MRSRALGLAMVALLALGLWGVWRFIGGNRAAIAQAQAESAQLAGERDSLVRVVGVRESLIRDLGLHSDSLESLAQWWRDSVDVLERDRAAAQLTVREVQTIGALEEEFRSAFPELGPPCPPPSLRSGQAFPPGPPCSWRMLTIRPDPRDSLGLQYLAVPAWFAETFVIDHQNAESWREQKDRLLAVDSLQVLLTALQDSITRLVTANAGAYASGYQTAYRSYQNLSNEYVSQLKRPHFQLKVTFGVLAGAGAGLIIGRATR